MTISSLIKMPVQVLDAPLPFWLPADVLRNSAEGPQSAWVPVLLKESQMEISVPDFSMTAWFQFLMPYRSVNLLKKHVFLEFVLLSIFI